MTKQAKIAQQIKRYIRQVADETIWINPRFAHLYEGRPSLETLKTVLRDAEKKIVKNHAPVIRELNARVGVEKDKKRLRTLKQVIKILTDWYKYEDFDTPGLWTIGQHSGVVNDPKKYDESAIKQLIAKVKSNPYHLVLGNYTDAIKDAKNVLKDFYNVHV